MEHTSARTKKPHLGRNITRLRELQGMKQETLASLLGISQQAVSKMEGSENIDEEKLTDVAKALNIPQDVLKNFNEDAAFNIIANTIHNHDQSAVINYQPAFNLLDEYKNEVQENKRLCEENKKLYEVLLKSEREKVALLEKILQEKR